MAWWRRGEIRLGLVLIAAAALCMVAGAIDHDDLRSQFLLGTAGAAPLTILTLVWASRRLERRRAGRLSSRRYWQEPWLPALVLAGSVGGLASPWLHGRMSLPGLAGVATGMIGIILLWAIVDPLSRNRRSEGPERFDCAVLTASPLIHPEGEPRG